MFSAEEDSSTKTETQSLYTHPLDESLMRDGPVTFEVGTSVSTWARGIIKVTIWSDAWVNRAILAASNGRRDRYAGGC